MKPRSAGVKLVYNGTDITADIAADIESISYEGNAADDSDSVNVTINAMADKWLNDWMPEKGTSLDPTILVYNWPEEGQGGEMNNGVMTVDDISYSDAPCTMTMSATSKPNDTSFSEEDREYIWKNTSIQKIAQTIAERYSLEMNFDGTDAEIAKREQQATDSAFLNELCKDYGLILKVYSNELWIYDREAFKKKLSLRRSPGRTSCRGRLVSAMALMAYIPMASGSIPTRKRKSEFGWKSALAAGQSAFRNTLPAKRTPSVGCKPR